MPCVVLTSNRDGFSLSGPLTFETVEEVKSLAQPYFQDKKDLIIHLIDIDKTDSAALALLIYWLKLAEELKINCYFKQIPEKISQTARLAGISQLLNDHQQ